MKMGDCMRSLIDFISSISQLDQKIVLYIVVGQNWHP
jgi:hypothetical protein